MIHPDDVAAWIAQARQHPEAAPGIIEALAARLIELDQQNETLRDELVRLSRGREPTAGKGRAAALARRVQTLERQLERGAVTAPKEATRSLFVTTLDGRAARLPLLNAKDWKARDDQRLVAGHLRPRHMLIGDDEAELLLFTDKGRVTRVNASDIDAAIAPISYLSLLSGLALDLDESIGVVVSLSSIFDRLTLITRKGYARSFRRAELESLLERNLPLHSSPIEGDYPAFVLLSDGKSELLVATRLGKGVRFPERAVGVQSQPAIDLDRGDVVSGAAVVDDETTIAIVGSEGTAARRLVAGFGAHATAGNRGKILTRLSDVVGVAPIASDDTLWLLTATGKLHAIPAARIPSGTGVSRGNTIVKLGEDRLVALTVT